jgi:hypothetical protein
MVVEGMWDVNFRKGLDEGQMAQWRDMERKLMGVTISDEEDTMVWSLEKNGVY